MPNADSPNATRPKPVPSLASARLFWAPACIVASRCSLSAFSIERSASMRAPIAPTTDALVVSRHSTKPTAPKAAPKRDLDSASDITPAMTASKPPIRMANAMGPWALTSSVMRGLYTVFRVGACKLGRSAPVFVLGGRDA